MLKSKLFAGAVGLSMILSAVAIPASAQTVAELTAQINSLLAMINQLQAQIAGARAFPVSRGVTGDSRLRAGAAACHLAGLWHRKQGAHGGGHHLFSHHGEFFFF